MFNMGLGEILIVLAVALIFVGPAKIPEIARTVGRGLGKLRRASDEVRDTIQGEIDALDREEIQKKIEAEKAKGGGEPGGPYSEKDPYVQEAAAQAEEKRDATTEAQSAQSEEAQRSDLTKTNEGANAEAGTAEAAAVTDGGADKKPS